MADFQRRQSAMAQPATQQMDISQVLQAISQQRQAEAFGLQSQEKTLQIEELKRQLDQQQRVRELVQSGASPQDITAQTGDVGAATNLLGMYSTQQDLLNKGLTAGQIRASTAQARSAAAENNARVGLIDQQRKAAEAEAIIKGTEADTVFRQSRVDNAGRAITNAINYLSNSKTIDPAEIQKNIQGLVDQFGPIVPGLNALLTDDGKTVTLDSVKSVMASGDTGRVIDEFKKLSSQLPTTTNLEQRQKIQQQLNEEGIKAKDIYTKQAQIGQASISTMDKAIEDIQGLDPAFFSVAFKDFAKISADVKATLGDQGAKDQLEKYQSVRKALAQGVLAEASKKALVGNTNQKEFETIQQAANGDPVTKEAFINAINVLRGSAILSTIKEFVFNSATASGLSYGDAQTQTEQLSRIPMQINLPNNEGTVYFADHYSDLKQKGLDDAVIVKIWNDGIQKTNSAKNLSNPSLQKFRDLTLGTQKP